MTKEKPQPAAKKLKFPPTINRKLEELKLDPMNAREHPPEQIAALRASIREYGPTKTIALDKTDTVRAGNGTVVAAQLEGYDEWPTVTLDLTPEQWVAYAIADNKIAMGSKWNSNLGVQLEMIAKLNPAGVASMTGFKAAELGKLKVTGFESTRKKIEMGDEQFGVIIMVEDEAKQVAMLDRFIAEGLKVKALI